MGVRARQAEQTQRADRPGPDPAPTAFETFFRTHYGAVVRLAQTVVGDAAAAQDVAQEVFLAAYRRFPGGYDQAGGWVRVAAVHTALNVVRQERRRDRRQRLVHAAGSPPDTGDYAAEAVIVTETRAAVRRCLARLPHRTAAVLVLRHGGCSYAEIAVALDVKVGHVGTLLRRAEQAMQREFEKESDHATRA